MASFEKVFCEKFRDIAQKVLSVECGERLSKLADLLGIDGEQAGERISLLAKVKFLKKFSIDEASLKQFPAELIIKYKILPLKVADDGLLLLACWPLSDDQVHWAQIALGKPVNWCLGKPKIILEVINEHFGLGVESANSAVEGAAIEEKDEDAVVIRFVNELIKRCINERATDIHFEPQRESLMIRYRVDGELIIARVPDNLKEFQSAIVSRLKIMARLNISEKRLPQDGKILFKFGNELIDIRVSTLPAVYGESVSLRLLSNSFMPKKIEDIFLNNSHKILLKHALTTPHGIILVTGPTGSGKSTTLSACLRVVREPSKRLMTVEDPVEYEIKGVNQTQVNAAIGLSFGNILRAILRQDPDIIMIGEIRDKETADIAIRASITGHLVLSTLHTNDAVGAITRLRDIGVEKFLLASALKLVVAQRLIRRLCPHCAVPDDLKKSPHSHIEKIFETTDFGQPKHEVGCEHCNHTGFFGRVGVFEFLEIDDAIHDAISSGLPESEIREISRKNNAQSLKADVLRKVQQGVTSISEALKIIEH